MLFRSRVGITSLSPVESIINDIIDIQDVKSGLNRKIPLLINPQKSLRSLDVVPIVLRSENLTSWSVEFSTINAPISVKVNGESIDNNYSNGGSNDELSISYIGPQRNSFDEHFYLLVKGIKADMLVFNRLFIVQY